ncbi:S10 family peptidase [Thalassotalea piscium]|uniref:Carboxypeptidase C (Cathepsin A) n=1 Tax=Thalassotalea piscium TaxID=1230533 RepID=A0A7X0NH83_9GAMM|nr:serine carboxypeptidase [Thalassotalea piscium]MBB6543431.1 carboxypeptidase C (cathepsin A) [Thalassotalea piscium]
MLFKQFFYPTFIYFCIFSSGVIQATEQNTDKEAATSIPEARQFISQHKGRFNGQNIEYTVTAGETYLRDKHGKETASIFTFAYTKKNTKGKTRPVTFIWNGGPGSASTWLHMGGFGPKRVHVPSDAKFPGNAPYPVLDTAESILDVSDLVFIDPVGTGFSRALGQHKGKEFWGLKEDAKSMASFIRTWITDNGRWNSPRFLLGESYGTTRAAAVAKILEQDLSVSLNGIVFISQALDYQGSSPYVPDNIISHITYLPTMAAAAVYHGKINPKPDNLSTFLAQARDFATDELMPALFKGNTISDATRSHIRDRLVHFTGLSPAYIEKANLRIGGFHFAKELLRDDGIAIGLLDARYTIDEADDLTAKPGYDASRSISSAYNAGLMSYIRSDLGVNWNRTYLAPADDELSDQWSWRTAPKNKAWEPTYVNTTHDLSKALRINPNLKVFVAAGYYDLVTPFFDAEYTLNRHNIKKEQIQYEYYHGGHMMYVHEPTRLDLLNDTRKFIQQQLK